MLNERGQDVRIRFGCQADDGLLRRAGIRQQEREQRRAHALRIEKVPAYRFRQPGIDQLLGAVLIAQLPQGFPRGAAHFLVRVFRQDYQDV